ncbi:MAG: glycosyltransferase family 2 protein [Patescibacteria group bacterium]
MNHKPILSVLIVTYNRVKFLETTASLFISQIINDGLSDKVEIIIGNDASSDGTDKYLNQLQSKYQFVKAINHSKNLGVSGNVLSVVAAARGEYIWMFGEDDLITEGAINKVLQSIHAHSPNYMLLNTQNILSHDDRNLDYEIIGDKRLDIEEDVLIGNFETEAKKLSKIKNWLYLTGLISTVACKKKLFLDWMDEARKYARADNVYLYQAPIIMGIAKLGGFNIIAEPLILHRKNENHWTGSPHKILGVNLYDSSEILDIIKDYMPQEHREYQKLFAAFVLATILSAKKNKVNVNKYIIDAIRKHYNCYPYNVRFLMALLTHGMIFRIFLGNLNQH